MSSRNPNNLLSLSLNYTGCARRKKTHQHSLACLMYLACPVYRSSKSLAIITIWPQLIAMLGVVAYYKVFSVKLYL